MRYKRAALKDHLGKITGTSAGALAGGLGGYGLAGLFSDNKSIKILAALAGAVGGGYGGYRLGNYMDTQRAGLQTDLSNANSQNARLNEQNAIQEGQIQGWKANDQEQKQVITGLQTDLEAQKTRGDNLNQQLGIGAQQYAKAVAGNAKAKALIDKQIKQIQQLKAQQQLP